MKTTYGTDRIARERWMQLDYHDWSPEHDSQHTDEQLVLMALERLIDQQHRPIPVRRIEQLVKAGALIAAEIDRLYKAMIDEILAKV